MKMYKKVIALCMTAAMSLGLAACGSSSSTTSTASAAASTASTAEASSTAATTSDKTYLVGICQLVQHPALDAATKGFEDELKKELGEDAVKFDEQNAAGDSATATTICTNLVSEKCDLILANATASLQAAAAATKDIPILGTSITEYGVALNIDGFDGTVGGNISGTSDLAPLDQQAAMVKEFVPDAKTLGILYCSAEPNSKYQADEVQKYAEEEGLTVKTYTFSDSNDVTSVTQQACSECDVLYIPTDNTAASCTTAINNVASQAKMPIICGEEGIMSGCGVATLSIDYYGLGQKTGEMAAKILKGESDISTMPIEYYDNPVKEYNPTICEQLGITAPDGYEAYTPDESSAS
ncbi:MAG: ABC transporter substrate-binding protein [Lachnospiraceae bacterium]|nr:ABC transporter substrate-binding protein [Lachnospiraceae bacterium]